MYVKITMDEKLIILASTSSQQYALGQLFKSKALWELVSVKSTKNQTDVDFDDCGETMYTLEKTGSCK